MGITVIPAYRVVATFARQSKGLPFEEAVDTLELKVREYARNLFSMLHPSIMDLGERTVVAQLGDPDPEALIEALAEIDAGRPKEIVEKALRKCGEHLARPDLNTRAYLLPGDGESRVMVKQMNGVLGFSLGAQATAVFLWPVDGWQRWLTYTVTHEYVHLVRNLLFPRGPTGSRLMYIKTQVPETLLDVIVTEGIADAFATQIYPDVHPRSTEALTPEVEKRLWPKVHRRLEMSDTTELRRILYGDNDRIPPWTGYTIGYRIVKSYLKAHPGTHPASLVGLPASTIFQQSGYAPAQSA